MLELIFLSVVSALACFFAHQSHEQVKEMANLQSRIWKLEKLLMRQGIFVDFDGNELKYGASNSVVHH